MFCAETQLRQNLENKSCCTQLENKMSNASDCGQAENIFSCYQSQEEMFANLGQQESLLQPTDVSVGQSESVPYIPCFGLDDYVEAEVLVTPRRDQQPIFKVSGERFAVAAVCKLILEAAEHFSKIQEVRQFKAEIGAIGAALLGNTFSSDIFLMRLAVSHHLVGLLIGWKGQNVQAIKLEKMWKFLVRNVFQHQLFN